ncbi:hypothetical protein GZ176_11900 [Dermatophilus congolensis]|uniref:glycoside hydrolase family 26 protein n=1 Tax=Dermatophilus congolensis TaxID=1863 RepID=UPI001AAF202F|nr:cellulase family glycosylhydrolase [Dermatophilus congolensis]MBO3146371.1 hypothetical protein [Dermatophilus congolensis]MBO3148586.1 hypothetical protein [Dermatophilus congolensis]MBO3157563.1 hypothetical protein [Dermatophilus congolensis]MBO3159900.1 hypothetical protein [Dermatophilus congolensis]MBO3166639.1 hypothetical protein [Dermatophilus congolensis]
MPPRKARRIAAATIAALSLSAPLAHAEPYFDEEQAPHTSTTPAAPQETTGQSGKPWASGIFSHNAEQTEKWEELTGQKNDILTVFPSRGSWESQLDPWWLNPGGSAIPQGYKGNLSVGIPLWPENGDLNTAANGGYADKWREFGKLVASKYPQAQIRLGWEMDLPGWYWHATDDNKDQWIAAFQHAVTVLREAAPDLRIVWNPNAGPSQSISDARLAYPGDEYVDVVAMDAYDWDPAIKTEADWEKHMTEPGGFQQWIDFARQHNKKFAIPEWGVVTHDGKGGGGDNPFYIKKMFELMQTNADIMDSEAYFEEPEGDYIDSSLLKNAPQSGETYRELSEKVRNGSPVNN